ncbi:MAG: 8-oxo-dGTP diphosphatase MutT [Rickettsiales bacterium]|nr:8-oxo-dGTP diphosphatase MutT [Rickettsiales bacterium]|tara:strand:- start:2293 stop:2688 length:396 start_codon:yes stop_codon:yes gene_type:complete
MEINVAAGILIKNKQILLTSRPDTKSFAGFWEFPGGKVKKGEFLVNALKRELFEELSIILNDKKIIFFCNYKIKRKNLKIHLNFFLCYEWFGRIEPNESQKYVWIFSKEIQKYKVLKSNRKVSDKLYLFDC